MGTHPGKDPCMIRIPLRLVAATGDGKERESDQREGGEKPQR